MTREKDDSISQLADLILEKSSNRQKPQMTSPSTAAGRPINSERRRSLPLPIGDEGDVLMVVDVGGGLLVPAWTPPPTVAADFHYQQFLTTFDGSSGWEFVGETIDGQDYPVMVLVETE